MGGMALRKTASISKKEKHFVATGLVVDEKCEKILLIMHKKLKTWLPPGGHIEFEKNELPDECVVREIREETGLDVEVISEAFDISWDKVETLHAPLLVQLEEISESHPQHVDMQYLCRVKSGTLHSGTHAEHEGVRWFDEMALKETEGLQNDVRENSFLALDKARDLKERGLF